MFKIIWEDETRKDFKHIAPAEAARIIRKVESTLSQNPQLGTALKGSFSGLYRYRIGDYRVIYEIINDEVTIIVVKVGHRREIYSQ
jgi:mRNA interferase RelE/StbE